MIVWHRLVVETRHPHALRCDLGRYLCKRISDSIADDGGAVATAHISGQGSGGAVAARPKQLGRKVGKDTCSGA